ncbi:hypothetical protein EU524_01935 [Candidatus Thorarchaeota archaeon]|nr:MAG: hypothetical protein EU524_01935 [Candidatus Thorarchaeota archaeon]
MKRVRVVTLVLALVVLFAAFSVQPVAAASRYDSLRSYMNERWDPVRGGYSLTDDVVRVDETYGAIVILDELGILANRPPPVDITKVLNFTTKYQFLSGDQDAPRYGGFMEFLLGPVTAERTHWGMVLWQTLKSQQGIPGTDQYEINETALVHWVNKTQTESGGFSAEPGLYPDIVSTYHALATLEILDTIYGEDLNAWSYLANESLTLGFIEDCRYGNGFMLSPISDREGVTATAAALLALEILDELATYPGLDAVKLWILDRQVTDTPDPDFLGGFEETTLTEDPNLQTTYWAMKGLDLLQGVEELNETIVQDFILSCQSADGAWALVPGIETGNLVYASYAAECLDYLGNARAILSSSVDPETGGGFVVDWRALVIVGIIIVALVLALLSIRMD